MRTQRPRIFSADFETTVYDGQTKTEVWAAAIVELFTEDVEIFNSIDKLFNYILSIKSNTIVYFHNIKFDGEFWIHYLLTKTDFKQAFVQTDPEKAEGAGCTAAHRRLGYHRFCNIRGKKYRTLSQ